MLSASLFRSSSARCNPAVSVKIQVQRQRAPFDTLGVVCWHRDCTLPSHTSHTASKHLEGVVTSACATSSCSSPSLLFARSSVAERSPNQSSVMHLRAGIYGRLLSFDSASALEISLTTSDNRSVNSVSYRERAIAVPENPVASTF